MPTSEIPNINELPDHAYMTRKQVALATNFTQQSLKMWASEGRGPKFRKIEGRLRYQVSDVRAWIQRSQS
ncbi:helix-turn-helix transcriptional regulator [Aquibium microcysteis]|uniref:helix-turn-helix transcriptional regulator n=1 Tax=Aquibium microcysteis TaxID=675281 RepID=UPI00165D218E|nr:helix-turn-helix domain-containing protein [Aquibium microcysteis]